jgi:DNA repair protein RadC
LICRETISIGSLNANIVHPREVFEPAITNHALSLIVAHNHPSGDPQPSEDDLRITKKLVKAGNLLGINLIDHLIISAKEFFSFKEKGLI